MHHIVGPMTPDQRKHIIINSEHIQWIFPHEIQFITKETEEENASQFFVEIMVIVHACTDMKRMEFKDILVTTKESFRRLENSYSVANYRFIKEFTKGVEDDWTINYILHVKPTDEMREKEKLVKDA